MQNKIALTEDLANLFIALSLKENYCTYRGEINKMSNSQGDYLLWRLGYNPVRVPDLFSMLTHILLMYDSIELAIFDSGYELYGSVTSAAQMKIGRRLSSINKGYFLSYEDSFPDELVISLKPFVINHCLKGYFDYPFLREFAEKTTGSLENLFSYIFDLYYNNASLETNFYIDSLLQKQSLHYDHTNIDEHLHDIDFDRWSVSTALANIQDSIENLLLIQDIKKEGPCDIYTPAFSDFSTATYVDDAYCILKNQISYIMDEQPAFESLTDILRFRDNNYIGIRLLRDEVSALESLLSQGGREQAIQKAIKDVRSANQSLIKDSVPKKTARIATYLSVPFSLLEYYMFGTSYSILIGVVGTTAQWIADQSDYENNWLVVAR